MKQKMAGKDAAAAVQPFSSLPPPPPSSRERVEKMIEEEEEEETRICWSREVDQNLTRLHSLQFGADLALDKDDHATAQILSLRLIGFLDSRSRTDDDEAFIRPIRRDALSKIVTARRSLFSESDRRTFEQAGRAPGHVFRAKGVIDIDKIKQSQYFRALVQQSEGRTVNELEEQLNMQEKLDCKISNVMKQAKLTSLYGNNVSRGNDNLYENSLKSKGKSPKEFIDLEGVHSHKSHHRNFEVLTSPKVEEEEKIYGNSLGTKRAHIEMMSSLGNDGIKSPSCNGEASTDVSGNGFVTARIKLEMDARQRRVLGRSASPSVSPQGDNNFPNRGYGMRSGYPRRGIRGNFVPPIRSNGGTVGNVTSRIAGRSDDALDESTKNCLDMLCGPDGELPEKLKNVEPRLIEHVSNEIMDQDPNVRWNDIAGLEHAKKCVMEMVIWPLLRPDLFKGCRSPGRGLLLFGPPGTGKTMIGKAIAGEAKATFFYISASSLTSKWIGEGEKLVRALFGVACCRQPAVIFVDEIDSLLSQRKSEGEHESSRRLKTQFLIEMEGFDSGSEQILLIGATNRPQELDEAARRRLTKRLYIPLPSAEARAWIIRNLLDKDGLFELSHEDIDAICNFTEGYSGSDMKNLVKDASMGPLRQALREGLDIATLKKDDMRSVTLQDFKDSMHEVRPSVSVNELGTYEEWNKQFGSTISL